jgi:2-oxoglutarate/2-oxoacid ferredoxin oxidoreductase subunit alpha
MSEGQMAEAVAKTVRELDTVVVRFVGDSGDGMQITGTQFTNASALAGNDISTLPDFPAEIRAPAGTLAGVSGFQIHFSQRQVFTPGDQPDVLVAMNPAALRANIEDLPDGGILIVDQEAFNEQNLKKAGYASNPLTDGSLDRFQTYKVDITRLTSIALKESGLSNKQVLRCKNFFTLGVVAWLYQRPVKPIVEFIETRFAKSPALVDANLRAFRAGFNFGDTTELFANRYEVRSAAIAPGRYRNITGNTALGLGLVAAAQRAGLPLFLGSYPITPASDILHELSSYKSFGVTTFQAEDEIAGVGAALGAAFGGALAVTTTSGPGIDLKSETIGLAVKTELPLIICDIQRGGPSTGLPTKTEQADLLAALYGRHGESPLAIIAPLSPADCFDVAIEAVRIAVKYMTPVMILSDGYLANGAEPWAIPSLADLPEIEVQFRKDPTGYYPYLREPETLSRPWVVPGTPGLEHRIGGLESEYLTGNISYAPANHEQMVRLRAKKIALIAQDVPPTEVRGPERGKVLILGWGSTYGAIRTATEELQAAGHAVAHAHLRHLSPLPPDLGDILGRYDRVLVPEMNMGQLLRVVRAEYLVDAIGYSQIQGRPFKVAEIRSRVERLLEEN